MQKPSESTITFIPRKVEPYEEGKLEHDTVTRETDLLVYEPVDGETIRVILWERYPDYDMIFGVPDKTNPRYEKELGFFTVRRVGHLSYSGHYFDLKESEAMVEGFQRLLNFSKGHSEHLWKKSVTRT